MTRRSALVATGLVSVLLLVPTLPAQTTDSAAPFNGVSKVRIVRLSEVKGQVQLDRSTGRGLEPAITNLPIIEKNRLVTAEGVAEVEFEDNSTLRIAPDSIVEFPQLERLAGGGTASAVHLVKGMAYVSLLKSNGNQFNLQFGDQDLSLSAPAHIRLQLDGTEARMAVLDGNLHMTAASGPMDVNKKKTITFDLLQHQQPTLAKDVLPEPYDEWDQTSTGYHSRVANVSAFNGSPYSYGLNDMSYYGSFMDAGGCGGGGGGTMWRPYFASAAWDPYSNGVWAYYQGAGYSWVSPYPWGWTPFHYGSWNYCPGMGWGWMPGGMWNGLNNMTMLNTPANGGGGVLLPRAPVRAPRSSEPGMVAVNSKPIVKSEMNAPGSFVFRKDSAGLGVPRDAFGKLEKFSQQSVQRGQSSEHVYFSAPSTAMNGGRPTSTAIMAGSIHRGTAPSPSSGTSSASSGGYQGRAGGSSSAPSMSNTSAASSHSGGSAGGSVSSAGSGHSH